MNKKLWVIIILVVVLGISFLVYRNITGSAVSGELDGFAQCLTDNGIKMYGTDWCSHCQNQKKLFGKSFKQIDFIDCDRNRSECLSAGIEGYPTWKINGESYPGEQSLERLSSLSGCEL